ncbi:MAG: hypothetical protein AB1757_05590 [Acidobacteriota bacterium]
MNEHVVDLMSKIVNRLLGDEKSFYSLNDEEKVALRQQIGGYQMAYRMREWKKMPGGVVR